MYCSLPTTGSSNTVAVVLVVVALAAGVALVVITRRRGLSGALAQTVAPVIALRFG